MCLNQFSHFLYQKTSKLSQKSNEMNKIETSCQLGVLEVELNISNSGLLDARNQLIMRQQGAYMNFLL